MQMQNMRSSGIVCFLALVLLKCLMEADVSSATSLDLHWKPATATWYGNPEGDGSDGGACGYGPLVSVRPFKARVTAVSPVLFQKGGGCGACYKVKCVDKSVCSRRAVTVIVTDECPGGGACGNGKTHFDLSGSAFGRMAIAGEGGQLRNRGELNIMYRRTPCKYPKKSVAFHVNEGSSEYFFSILVVYEGGDGDIGSMQLKQGNSDQWLQMTRLWGANWCFNGGPLKAPFSLKLTTLSTGKTVQARNIIPTNWSPKSIYNSRLTLV